MIRSLASVLLAMVLAAGATLQASDAMKAIAGSYLEIQSRLAGDSVAGVKAAALAIGAQADRMGKAGEAIARAAKKLEGAADVKAAREAFGGLSDAVIAAGNAEGWKDLPDLRVAYCPMVNKSWVQKGEAISNPYLGRSMPTCGVIKK